MDYAKFFIDANDTYLIVVDVQERLAPATREHELCSARIARLLDAAALLSYRVGVTEQYPKGLGPTLPELTEKIQAIDGKVFEKTKFNACTDEIMADLRASGRKSVIVTGMETHICVFQTVRQLLKEGYKVFVPYDCVTSRAVGDYEAALELFRQMGAVVTSSESLLYDMMTDSRHPQFKEVSKLVK